MGRSRFLALVALALLVSACSQPPSSASVTPAPPAIPMDQPVLIAAGDIAACDRDGDSDTADLVAGLEGVVATLGDHAYPNGSDETFSECYDPVWGAFLDRTRPAVGNHDLSGDGGDAYHSYFGNRAGNRGDGWYSYDIGDWHVVVLNTNCEIIGCAAGSPQHEWLVADLADSGASCTLAYGHHPRFSSGPHGDYPPVGPLWEALHEADADLILVGHDHLYERFAPQTPAGEADPDGIRQFTAGTGGYGLSTAERTAPNSERILDDAFGVLELTLHAGSYDWRFLTVDGVEADAGSGACH